MKRVKHVETGAVYGNLEMAARAMGVSCRTMVNYLTPSRKKVKGFHFVKENEDGTFPEVVIEKEEPKVKTPFLRIWFNNSKSIDIENYTQENIFSIITKGDTGFTRIGNKIINLSEVKYMEELNAN